MGDIEQRSEEPGADSADAKAIVMQVSPRIADVPAADWDACARGSDSGAASSRPANPFISHVFLQALEASGSAIRATGWLPQHVLLKDGAGCLLGAMPCYLKSHSYGEYVFDHAWANAYERAGGSYYPKLQVAVPFTPVTGTLIGIGPCVIEDIFSVGMRFQIAGHSA